MNNDNSYLKAWSESPAFTSSEYPDLIDKDAEIAYLKKKNKKLKIMNKTLIIILIALPIIHLFVMNIIL
jgi:hypothetical protein